MIAQMCFTKIDIINFGMRLDSNIFIAPKDIHEPGCTVTIESHDLKTVIRLFALPYFRKSPLPNSTC